MYRLFSALALGAALCLAWVPAHAAAPSPDNPAGLELGVVPVHGQASPFSGAGGGLIYHSGGSVQTGTHHTYAIYWGTSFSSTYQSLINSYFTNVAAASGAGATNNVYESDTQYYQNIGGTTYITYSEQFVNSWSDSVLPTSNGCSSTAGGPVCVSDAQVQQEVAKAIKANNWPTGLGAEYFVFLGDGISTCYSSSSCFVSQFCAYHSHYGSGGSTVLYANMPYTGHSLSACGSGSYPNGDSAADSTINVTSHEANETITDALGNAWYDRRGYENGDKCAWNFGSPTNGYNQTINGTHYYLQGEWSNASSGCVWSGV